MLLVIFCLIRPISSLFAKADFPDVRSALASQGVDGGVTSPSILKAY